MYNFVLVYICELDNGENSEINCVGWFVEFRVVELYVFFFKFFDDYRGVCVCDLYRECCI